MRRNRDVRTYRGRALSKPNEDVVDQGLAFDVGTLLSRRRMFGVLGLGVATAGLAACGGGSTSSPSSSAAPAELPGEIAGPFPGDGTVGPSDVLEQSGIIRRDIRSSFGDATGTAAGVPMTLELTVIDIASGGTPFTGAAVYLWQCDREGLYSLYSPGVENQNYLRGVQIADDSGKVAFDTIFPACYQGRWPHFHFEVFPDQASITDADKAILTSQIALPEDACDAVYKQPGYEQSIVNMAPITLQNDAIFLEDGAVHQLATVTGDVNNGYDAKLTVAIDPNTPPVEGDVYLPDGTKLKPGDPMPSQFVTPPA